MFLSSGVTNILTLNDFVSISGKNYLAHNYLNNIIGQIDNGAIHETTINRSELIKFEVGDISTIPSFVYTTKHEWNHNIINRFGYRILDYEYLSQSGKSLSLTNIPPQSLRSYRSEHIKPNYDKIENLFGSISAYNDSGDNLDYYKTNIETFSLDNQNEDIYYGGSFNDNRWGITNFRVKERIANHLAWSDYYNESSGNMTLCNPFVTFVSYWSGFYGFAKLVSKHRGHHYCGNLSATPHSTTIERRLIKSPDNSFFPYVDIGPRVVGGIFGFDIYKDAMTYFSSPCDLDKADGSLIIDYLIYKENHNCLTDFYPQGYRIVPTGATVGDNNGFLIDTYNVAVGGYYTYNIASYDKHISTLDVLVSSTLFSSGTLTIPHNITNSGMVDLFSGITPYGIKCIGSSINNMFVIAHGSGDVASGLVFEDFTYNAINLDLRLKCNKINNKGGTTGKIGESGNIAWEHNHGCDLIRYDYYVGTGIEESNIYVPPNHAGEIYRVSYDKKNNRLYTIGNLVNKFVNSNIILQVIPSSVVNFEASSILMSTGDYFAIYGLICVPPVSLSGAYYCYYPTSVFTGLETRYVPTGFLVSNYRSVDGSGLEEAKFNKKSLAYIQSKTSDLRCGETSLYPNYLVSYSGAYPHIEAGLVPVFVRLENNNVSK